MRVIPPPALNGSNPAPAARWVTQRLPLRPTIFLHTVFLHLSADPSRTPERHICSFATQAMRVCAS